MNDPTQHTPINHSAYTLLRDLIAGRRQTLPADAYDAGDWRRIVSLAEAHGVAPLLHRTLQQHGRPGDLPEPARGALDRHYYNTTAQNALLYRELRRLLDALADARTTVTPIVLKGAALGATLYADTALRPLSDIDLLVPRESLDRIADLAQERGFRAHAPELRPGVRQTIDHHLHLRGGPRRDLVVELHWTLVGSDTGRYTPSLDWFWEQTDAWMPEGSGAEPAAALQLTPTAHLLYLAAHLMLQHGEGEGRLIWFYDLHLLLTKERERIDWEQMIARADDFHWAPALLAALERTQALYGSPLPQEHMHRLATVAAQDTEGTQLVARQAKFDTTRVERIRNKLSGMSWQGRFGLIVGQLFPHPEFIRWRYEPAPAWLWPLYYLYRWLDIFGDVLRTMTRVR